MAMKRKKAEPPWMDEKDWLVTVCMLPAEEDNLQDLNWIGKLSGFAFTTNTRMLALVGDPDVPGYELLFAFDSAEHKRRFIQLVKDDGYADPEDENAFWVPAPEAVRDARPISEVFPEDEANYIERVGTATAEKLANLPDPQHASGRLMKAGGSGGIEPTSFAEEDTATCFSVACVRFPEYRLVELTGPGKDDEGNDVEATVAVGLFCKQCAAEQLNNAAEELKGEARSDIPLLGMMLFPVSLSADQVSELKAEITEQVPIQDESEDDEDGDTVQ